MCNIWTIQDFALVRFNLILLFTQVVADPIIRNDQCSALQHSCSQTFGPHRTHSRRHTSPLIFVELCGALFRTPLRLLRHQMALLKFKCSSYCSDAQNGKTPTSSFLLLVLCTVTLACNVSSGEGRTTYEHRETQPGIKDIRKYAAKYGSASVMRIHPSTKRCSDKICGGYFNWRVEKVMDV